MKLRPQDVAICLLLIMWTVNYDVSRAPWLAPKHASQSLCSVTNMFSMSWPSKIQTDTDWLETMTDDSCWFMLIQNY